MNSSVRRIGLEPASRIKLEALLKQGVSFGVLGVADSRDGP